MKHVHGSQYSVLLKCYSSPKRPIDSVKALSKDQWDVFRNQQPNSKGNAEDLGQTGGTLGGLILLDFKTYDKATVITAVCRGIGQWNKINPETDPCIQLIFHKGAQSNLLK